MDRSKVLSKLDPKLHGAADQLAAAGFDWTSIFALLMQIAPVVLDWLKRNPPQMRGVGDAVGCPEGAKAALASARTAACEALCAVMCAEHCLCCDE